MIERRGDTRSVRDDHPSWIRPVLAWSLIIPFMLAVLWVVAALPVLGTTKEWDDCYAMNGRPAHVSWFPVPKAFCELDRGKVVQIAGPGAD